jgi:hypothetical protein
MKSGLMFCTSFLLITAPMNVNYRPLKEAACAVRKH